VRDHLSTVGAPEGRPQMMGNRMSIMLAPVHGKPAPEAAKSSSLKAPVPAAAKPAPRPAVQPAPAPSPEQAS